MKKVSEIKINPEKLLNNKDLLNLKGGVTVPKEACAGDPCVTDNNCCPQNPHCIDLPNWPSMRVCVSP